MLLSKTHGQDWFGIRPGELVRLKEKHIDTGNGYLIIPDPKEKKPKLVPLPDKDIELIRSIPKGFPELPFFRHKKGLQSVRENQPFGEKYFYKWWVRACEALGIGRCRYVWRHNTQLNNRPAQIQGA